MREQHYLIRGGPEGREPLRALGRVMRPTTLPLGVAIEEDVDRLADELYALARDPRTYVANPRIVQVFGEKPSTHA